MNYRLFSELEVVSPAMESTSGPAFEGVSPFVVIEPKIAEGSPNVSVRLSKKLDNVISDVKPVERLECAIIS